MIVRRLVSTNDVILNCGTIIIGVKPLSSYVKTEKLADLRLYTVRYQIIKCVMCDVGLGAVYRGNCRL